MYISFTHPLYLVFLFVIPILIFFHFYGLKNMKGKALKFANFEAIARVKGIDLYSKNILLLIFNILFVVLLVFSLAGLSLHKEVTTSSFSFVIAIDNSESMSALDLSPNRLAVAKETAKGFINNFPYQSSIGVISFSGNSKIEQPLTENKQEADLAIDNIEISEVKGTDIYEAISNSIEVLKNEKNKAIILLSDGQINVGSINEAIDYAKYTEVLVHTIGMGTVEGGEVSYGLSKLDEDSLKSLAYNTGGKYFNAQNKQELEKSFNGIVVGTKRLAKIDLSFYLIIAVIILFIIKEFLLSINKIVW
ncbi:MAG: VWA domain-containing protein [Candidatus Nanoarchaeia archaeon]|nr:VWA domain-containing protein [Candidatus Nanoarchaeia archaeon]MDD5741412.1 VWA domain-containing protein [Candidatus Nanoarchaeia archaeon]